MAPSGSLPGDQARAEDAAEYTLRRGIRHRDEEPAAHRMSSRSLRNVYFGLSAAWGFVVGSAGILVSLAYSGHDIRPEGRALFGLLPAVLVAIAGGGVIAGAYQEARRRR